MIQADDPPAALWPRFLPSGDAALTVELGEGVDRAVCAKVVRLHRHLLAHPLEGVTETLPTFRSLLIQFDPRIAEPAALEAALADIVAALPDEPLPSRRWTIPVCYDPQLALDIEDVAGLSGMSVNDVIACQSGQSYYIYMLGFLPGYAYMGDVPQPLQLPRRKDPRTRVPAGSLAIATAFASIYPFESPGGWHIIGRTPLGFFDANAERPALLAPGDAVRFEPISLAAFQSWKDTPAQTPALTNGGGG